MPVTETAPGRQALSLLSRRKPLPKRCATVLRSALMFGALIVMLSKYSLGADIVVSKIKPSDADPTIIRFDEPNLVVFDRDQHNNLSNLVVFFPGTDGAPVKYEKLLTVVAMQGFRVIGLEYNDSPAVIQICAHNLRASCSAEFREERTFGNNPTKVVNNAPEESIVRRLAALLNYLAQHNSEGDWGKYLRGNDPDWTHIVVSGFSQGAGMAAYIAKREPVSRVVLFSGPWDFDSTGLAPWLSGASITPSERWFAAFHRRENTSANIAIAYEKLGIPIEHIRVLNLDLPTGLSANTRNPFHASTVKVQEYESDWILLFGHST